MKKVHRSEHRSRTDWTWWERVKSRLFDIEPKKPGVPGQITWVWCPCCHYDLVGSESFFEDTDLVRYECTLCGTLSEWDFDMPCPSLIRQASNAKYTRLWEQRGDDPEHL